LYNDLFSCTNYKFQKHDCCYVIIRFLFQFSKLNYHICCCHRRHHHYHHQIITLENFPKVIC
jgi:hypothetical protein